MIEKLNQRLHQFYQFSLVFIMVATIGTILYFWKLGFIDGSRSKELHKANYTFEQIEKQNTISEIRTLILNEDIKAALSKVNELENNLEQINTITQDPKFDELKNEVQQMKSAAANLLSFPKLDKILNILNEKVIKFHEYVKYNNWKTLTRASSRVLEQTKGHINRNQLKQLVTSINKEIEQMKVLTENSILSRPEKAEIISRVTNFQVELDMMSRYVEERTFSNNIIKSVEVSLNKWFEKISPEISYQKLQTEQVGRYYIIGLFALLTLTFACFSGAIIFSRFHRKKSQNEIEKFIENYVTEGLIAGKVLDLKKFSESFQNFTGHICEYIEKRMSFGQVFQEALPLSSVLLDKNLKVTWANKQFCDDWSISEVEINKDYLSWDYLSKLTNLGDDDPVLEALKHNVAGIYQVQIKPTEESELRPYEMFVSPVRIDNETRVMLFFYPLMSLQETISSQSRSIINPIEKTLDIINHGQFNLDEVKNLEKDFVMANIAPILDKFQYLVEKHDAQKANLLDHIEMLYTKLEVATTMANAIDEANQNINRSNSSQIANLKLFKQHVIELSSKLKNCESIASSEQSSLKVSLSTMKAGQLKANKLRDMLEQVLIAIPKFGAIREDIKEQKSQMIEAKMRVSHSLAQMVHLKKLITNEDVLNRFNNSFDRVWGEFKKLEGHSSDFDKRLTNLEVILSKTQMLVNDISLELPNLQLQAEFEAMQELESAQQKFFNDLTPIQQSLDANEEAIIESLKSLYMNLKESVESNRNITSFLAQKEGLQQSLESKQASTLEIGPNP
jgi:hypothetical protein